ncbi:GDSL esterase/lipase At2g03980-like [Vicia villosa]|uniref:GDSL esterase/lipase At2g03980-like n=1 Tax=Vicia villosa TaxID=3911 RepID=UPI00273BCB33|nr:GDSL esterase/lipase At2g03980-like [Vicia villosa]
MNTKYLIFSDVLITMLFLSLAISSSSTNSSHQKHFPAMYVFGDSLVDSGNNNYLPIQSNAKFPPYGIDFGGKPTGRYTNGKTVVDYLAIHLGLPLVPPYLGLSNTQRNKITTGINFASAGSGILPQTSNGTLSLDKQIKLFRSVIKNNLPNTFDEKEKLEKHLSESLFVVSDGVNDHFRNGTFVGSTIFASYLIKQLSIRLKKIYSLGARRFFMYNIAPAGCFPSTAARSKPRGKCNEKMNKAISSYNKLLPTVLEKLQAQLPGFTFMHSDLYESLIYLRKNGHKYGILETWKPCCPNRIHGNLKCHPYNATCPDRNTHLFFDIHPSQIANQIYATRCFNEKTICKSSLSNFLSPKIHKHSKNK